jgi:hypothetical protein
VTYTKPAKMKLVLIESTHGGTYQQHSLSSLNQNYSWHAYKTDAPNAPNEKTTWNQVITE